MKKSLILIALVLFVVLWILYKVNTAARLDYQIGIPKQISLRNGQLTFLLPMRITNPSGGSINLREVQADVLSAGRYIGRATLSEPVRIGPRQETVLNISVAADYFDLLTAASGVFASLKGGTIGLQISGLIYAEGFQIPIENQFDFTLPKF